MNTISCDDRMTLIASKADPPVDAITEVWAQEGKGQGQWCTDHQ